MGGKPKVKSVKKKKHISKHILEAKKAQNELSESQKEEPQMENAVNKKRKQKKNRHVKSPSEAAEYLEQWKAKKSGDSGSTWKFNKNTQSWLIRHMYEVEKVPKGEFALMLEYLEGLEGQTTKSRIKSEATRRASRYKRHEKANKNKAEAGKDTTQTDAKEDSTSSPTNDKSSTDKPKKSKADEQEEAYEQARWTKLSELDKRKEYKRALKILSLLKA